MIDNSSTSMAMGNFLLTSTRCGCLRVMLAAGWSMYAVKKEKKRENHSKTTLSQSSNLSCCTSVGLSGGRGGFRIRDGFGIRDGCGLRVSSRGGFKFKGGVDSEFRIRNGHRGRGGVSSGFQVRDWYRVVGWC